MEMNDLVIDIVKWNIRGFSRYGITEKSEVVNLQTGRYKKEFVSNGVRSYDLWDDGGKKCRKSINQLRKLAVNVVNSE
jgi:hypothetical protein